MTTRFSNTLRRRDFIRLFFASTTAALVLPACGDDANPANPDPSADMSRDGTLSPDVVAPNPNVPLTDVRSEYFEVSHTDADAPLRIGQRYLDALRSDPSVSDPNTVVQPTVDLINGADTLDAAIDALREAVSDDFDAFNVVLLEGWTFARTELNLCALATLT